MKDLDRLVLGCIAGGCLGASTFFLLDALFAEQPAHAIETRSERALETLNVDWGSENRKEKLRTQIARECASARSIRDQAIALAKKSRTINQNHYEQALALTQRANAYWPTDAHETETSPWTLRQEDLKKAPWVPKILVLRGAMTTE